MKASPNREQQLFLITGGVILLLILVVVIFNMVSSPSDLVEEDVAKRPMVKLTDRMGRSDRYQNKGLSGTAAVFSNHVNDELNYEKLNNRTVLKPGESLPTKEQQNAEAPPEEGHVLGGQTPDEELQGGWNRSPAELEAVRKEVAFKKEEARKLAEAKKKKAEADKLKQANAEKLKKAQEAKQEAARRIREAELASKRALERSKAAKQQPVTNRAKELPPTNIDFSKAIADALAKQKKAQQNQQPKQYVAKKQLNSVKPVAKKEPARAVEPSGSVTPKNGYSMQIASLSNAERSRALQSKLRSVMFNGKRMPVYQETANIRSKTYYRVRLGPFSTRTKAEKAGRLIKEKIGMEGRLIKPSKR
ncbi:MAG: SPOR domain-containing protein [Magnetococcales bacterium]|nr:SPOR domain-containing protein [Magnetococcales bacterium]